MLKDRFQAEDVLQEAMVIAWNKSGDFDPALANAKTWITTIARRRALDLLRSRKRRFEVLHNRASGIREVFGQADNGAGGITRIERDGAPACRLFWQVEPGRGGVYPARLSRWTDVFRNRCADRSLTEHRQELDTARHGETSGVHARMNYHDPERLEALTRQFVLGTMSRRARRRFGQLMDDDAGVAARVYALEEQMLPMAWGLQPVRPSALVWQRIANQAGFGRTRSRSGRPWSVAAAAMFAAVMVTSFGWWQTLQRPPEVRIETITQQVPVDPAIGVINGAAGEPLWVARIYPDLQRADIAVSNTPDPQEANDYELWILRDDGVPFSLGVLPQTGQSQNTLTAEAIDALGRGDTLAVSLEPPGGSPTSAPTGPVLYTAALLSP